MQVFCEWMQACLEQREEDSEKLREQMIEAFAEAERRYKEALVARMLEEAEGSDASLQNL